MTKVDDEISPLPSDFVQRLTTIIPTDQHSTVFASFAEPKSVAFRVNRLLSTTQEVLVHLQAEGIDCQSVSWLPEAFTVADQQRSLLTRHEWVNAGKIYIHNLSSMMATMVLAPQPEETILDMAAAPGGKTLHMAAQMEGRGFLSAVEVVSSRFYKLKENLRRGGAAFVRTYLMDGRQVPRKTGPRFDRVLLDAPCSGEARFHQSQPDSFDKWSPRKIRECSRKQLGLIQAGFDALRPGGRMLYCTCSFAPEENEAIVQHLLDKRAPSCQLLEIDLPFANWQAGLAQWERWTFDPSLQQCRRILPTTDHDGLFMALIEKTETVPRHRT